MPPALQADISAAWLLEDSNSMPIFAIRSNFFMGAKILKINLITKG
jgi:hypothetical protein